MGVSPLHTFGYGWTTDTHEQSPSPGDGPCLPGPASRLRRDRRALQVELVDLTDQVSAVAVVRLLIDERESPRQVDLAGRDQRIIRPELHPLVTGAAGEVQARVDEPGADPVAPRGGVDQQDPELGRGPVRFARVLGRPPPPPPRPPARQ